MEQEIGNMLWLGISLSVLVFVIVSFIKTIQIVPQKMVYIVERLGRYSKTLDSGMHILIPFVDRVAYKHTMKEQVLDSTPQSCVTKDNIEVGIDGVLYIQVIDPVKASYGIQDYRLAASQLAQTTMRSVIGQIDLDKSFEEREVINDKVTQAVDEAAGPWGVKVLRYEIADIALPHGIKDALERQMRSERDRRAKVAESEGERQYKINVSEGERQSKINESEGLRQEIINLSEAEKQRQINEAMGRAKEIELIAESTANGIRAIAEAIKEPGGSEAVNLRIAEQYVKEFGNLAKANNTLILPAELSNIGGAVAGLSEILKTSQHK